MDDVAHGAGVSRALLYKYFPNKKSLFVAVVNDLSDRMLARTAKSIDPDTTPFEQVRTGVLGYLKQYEKHPYAADSIVLGVGATNPQLLHRDKSDRKYLSELLTDRLRETLCLSDDAPAAQLLPALTRAWLAFTEEFIRQWMLDRSLGRDEVADQCAHALLDTLVRLPGLAPESIKALTT
jgi:AcrR family transcriptional regulator